MEQQELALDIARRAIKDADRATGEDEMERLPSNIKSNGDDPSDFLEFAISQEKNLLQKDLILLKQNAEKISKRKIFLRKLHLLRANLCSLDANGNQVVA